MRTLDVFLQKNGKIRLDFTDESYGEVYIEVLNSSGQAVYSNRTNVIFDEVSCSTDKLPQGSYRIVIKANENFVDFEVNTYIVYTPDWKYPEVTTDSKKIKIVRGKTKKINYIVTHNKQIMRFIGHLKILLLQKLCPMEL